jgi:hypothetical protein
VNYCHLSEKLKLLPSDVYSLLSSISKAYYDIEKSLWIDAPNRNSIRIKRYNTSAKESLLNISNYDEYTNQVTMMPWEELRDYLQGSINLINILHAAFIIDIAERNCLPLSENIECQFSYLKSDEPVILFTMTYKRNFDPHKAVESCIKSVYDKLNLVAKKNAFIRV